MNGGERNMKKRTYFQKRSIDLDKWISEYEHVKTWLSKLQVKHGNAFNLYRFCKWCSKNPNELLSLKDDAGSREAERLLDTFVIDEKVDLTVHARGNIVGSVRSFFKHNYKDLASVAGRVERTKIKPYSKPSKENLVKLWNSAYNPRDRALVSFVNSTAIARETLTKLRFSHFEKNWKNQEVPHISLDSSVIKGSGRGRYKGVRQETFLTPEAKTDLIYYIEWLERKSFKFNADTLVFRSIKKPYKPLSYGELGVIARRISIQSGVSFSWHDGRRYVETALEEARISVNWCRKIRGRKVRGEEAPYSLPSIKRLRQAYKTAVPLLQFRTSVKVDALQQRKQSIIDNMRIMGMTEQEIEDMSKKMDGYKTASELDHALRGMHEQEDCQKVVSESELEAWLMKGWKVITTLPSGKVVVESNNHT